MKVTGRLSVLRFKALVDGGRTQQAFRKFDKFCWQLEADLEKDKSELKKLIRAAGVVVTLKHTVIDFVLSRSPKVFVESLR